MPRMWRVLATAVLPLLVGASVLACVDRAAAATQGSKFTRIEPAR